MCAVLVLQWQALLWSAALQLPLLVLLVLQSSFHCEIAGYAAARYCVRSLVV
jgi:hypothetical protein